MNIGLFIYLALFIGAISALWGGIYVLRHRRNGDWLFRIFILYTISLPIVGGWGLFHVRPTLFHFLIFIGLIILWYALVVIYAAREKGASESTLHKLRIASVAACVLVPTILFYCERYLLDAEYVSPSYEIMKEESRVVERNGVEGLSIHIDIRFFHLKNRNCYTIVEFQQQDQTSGVYNYIDGNDKYSTSDRSRFGLTEAIHVFKNYYSYSFYFFIPYEDLPHTKGTNHYCYDLHCRYQVKPTNNDLFWNLSEDYTPHVSRFFDHTYKYASRKRNNRKAPQSPAQQTTAQEAQASTQKQPSEQTSIQPLTRTQTQTQTQPSTPSFETPGPIRFSSRSWKEDASFGGVPAYTEYKQSSNGWTTAVYHQRCVMCSGTGFYGLGYCPLCKGAGESTKTSEYIPLNEYYYNDGLNVANVIFSRAGMSIFGLGGNYLFYEESFTVQKKYGDYYFGGNIGHAAKYQYISYPHPPCRLSADFNTLVINGETYRRITKNDFDRIVQNYEALCGQMGVQAYNFYVPDMSNSSSASNSSSSGSSSSSMSRYGSVSCHFCNGSGRCPTCNGTGVMTNTYTGNNTTCSSCHGRNNAACPICHGTGKRYGLK